MLAFHNEGADGRFVGWISDPIPWQSVWRGAPASASVVRADRVADQAVRRGARRGSAGSPPPLETVIRAHARPGRPQALAAPGWPPRAARAPAAHRADRGRAARRSARHERVTGPDRVDHLDRSDAELVRRPRGRERGRSPRSRPWSPGRERRRAAPSARGPRRQSGRDRARRCPVGGLDTSLHPMSLLDVTAAGRFALTHEGRPGVRVVGDRRRRPTDAQRLLDDGAAGLENRPDRAGVRGGSRR